jgi:hypothetical protein
LLKQAGVIEMGLDASATVNAGNSIEKMLSHELAAAHAAVMKMFGQMREGQAAMPDACERAVLSGNYGSLNQEICRTSGAIARLMLAMQQGALTLQRLRQGARQTVRVEHVQVTRCYQQSDPYGASRERRQRARRRVALTSVDNAPVLAGLCDFKQVQNLQVDNTDQTAPLAISSRRALSLARASRRVRSHRAGCARRPDRKASAR